MKRGMDGVHVPLATAFTSRGEIDVYKTRKLIRFVCQGGVHGVIPAGSTGEFFGLTKEDRKQLLEMVMEEVDRRIPVFAGTGAVTTKETVELTQQAEKLGADGALIITPFYISPTQDDLYEHYATIARNTRLPIIIYSNPARTGGVTPSPQTIRKLARIKNMVALKDSSGNLALTAEYVRQTRDEYFSVMMGQDKLFYAGLVHGCTSLVAATANVVPRVVVDLYEAFRQKDFDRCLALQEKITLIRTGFELLPFPVAAKAMMKLAGIDVGRAKPPLGAGKAIPLETLAELERIVKTVKGE